jgi:hypothetical protein
MGRAYGGLHRVLLQYPLPRAGFERREMAFVDARERRL